MEHNLLKAAVMANPNEILQPYDTIMGLEGFDAICKFAEMLGGLTVYVPHARSIFAGCLEAEVRKEFNGKNIIALAKKYGYSERHVRRMFPGGRG